MTSPQRRRGSRTLIEQGFPFSLECRTPSAEDYFDTLLESWNIENEIHDEKKKRERSGNHMVCGPECPQTGLCTTLE
jgi:hypothetical protein